MVCEEDEIAVACIPVETVSAEGLPFTAPGSWVPLASDDATLTPFRTPVLYAAKPPSEPIVDTEGSFPLGCGYR